MKEANAHALLVQYLADRDVPCPVCKYNVRRLTTDTCPECGQMLALGIHAVDYPHGPWIAALIGASCGLGFFLAMGGLLLWMSVWAGWTPSMTGREITTLLVGLGVCCGAELLLLLFARRFRRLPPGVAWPIAAACWVMSVVSCIAFLWLV